MRMQSLIDWWRVLRNRGADPDAAEPIYPAPMSHEETVALDRLRARRSKGRRKSGRNAEEDAPRS